MSETILFLTESREDYLADSLLHGLISAGYNVTDYPRKDILYKQDPNTRSSLLNYVRGGGFTLYNTLAENNVNRELITQRIEAEEFSLVILGQVWRQWGQLLDLSNLLQRCKVVLLDGDDDTRLFHRSGTKIKQYGLQPFPIRSGRCLYLKRELQPTYNLSRLYKLKPAHFSIPHHKIRKPNIAQKKRLFATHCVDSEVAQALRLHTSYAFHSETDYYENLSTSKYAISTKRGGWDCLRHYEIAASGTLPCIKNLHKKPTSSAPFGLIPNFNCLSYVDWDDLNSQVSALEMNTQLYQTLLANTHRWALSSTTKLAAQQLLAYASEL